MSHRKRKIQYKDQISPRICTQTNTKESLETSLCACTRASLTVEASIIVPLMVGFLAIILFFFRFIQVQVAVEEALIYTGRKVAVESCMMSSEEVLYLSAEAIFREAISENEIINRYIKNKSNGIQLLKSEFADNEIWLRAEYEIKLPVAFFSIDSVELSSENCFQKWIGNRDEFYDGDWVYITQNGTVYHSKKDCRALDISVKRASASKIENYRGENGQKYYACDRCKEEGVNWVYYTDYGTLFHAKIDCSSLKRTIEKIRKDEVGNRRICVFCNM